MILGRGFRGALNYVSAVAKSATTDHKGSLPPFFTNMAGRTSKELAAEFGTLRKLRPNLTKAAGHLILAHDPTQKQLTESEWKEAISIALNTHGADQAAFAAWQHFDTGTSHCHVIFSRVLTTNQVVSDSNNYRTNEIAARLIERTFMLDAPTPTASEDRPGDRQAQANAGRRADRRGTPDGSKINAQAIRTALSKALDRKHFEQLMAEIGIEAEFDRRGQNREIYGWRLRRQGSEEWLKASTVAKDLSWPKIAHRFAESDSTKETPAPALGPIAALPVVVAAEPEGRRQDRIPQMLRPLLQKQAAAAAKQVINPSPFAERLNQASQRLDDLAPVATSPLLLTSLAVVKVALYCVQVARNIAAVVMLFLRCLLACFGVTAKEPLQYSEQPVTPELSYEPVKDQSTPAVAELEALDKSASDAVLHVLDCVQNGRPDDLPMDVEGRAELVAAMVAAKTGTPPGQADQLAALFENNETALTPAPMAESKPKQVETLVSLNKSMMLFVDASISKTDALAREMPEVAAARRNLELANKKLRLAKAEYQAQKAKKGVLGFLVPSEQKVTTTEENELTKATQNLETVKAKHPPGVPVAIAHKHADALLKVKAAAAAHHAQMMREAENYSNANVKKVALHQAQIFKSKFEMFERMPISGFLHESVLSAKSAPKAIAAALDDARKEEEIAGQVEARRQAYVASEETSSASERPGQE